LLCTLYISKTSKYKYPVVFDSSNPLCYPIHIQLALNNLRLEANVNQKDLSSVAFAVPWQKTNIVMVFNSNAPSQAQIADAEKFYLRYKYPDQPIEERLLEAEGSALSNMKQLSYHFNSPFKVFPILDQAIAVVECIFEGIDGLNYSDWTVFTDEEKWQAFQAAVNLLDKAEEAGDKLAEMSGHNSMLFLTRHSYGRWLVVYLNNHWQHTPTKEVHKVDDIDDNTAYGYVHCRTCGYDSSIMYWLYDRGDRMRAVCMAWQDHNEQHPDCKGILTT
jgi:hypothetical protein